MPQPRAGLRADLHRTRDQARAVGDARFTPNPPKRCALALTQGLMGKGGRTGQARFQ